MNLASNPIIGAWDDASQFDLAASLVHEIIDIMA